MPHLEGRPKGVGRRREVAAPQGAPRATCAAHLCRNEGCGAPRVTGRQSAEQTILPTTFAVDCAARLASHRTASPYNPRVHFGLPLRRPPVGTTGHIPDKHGSPNGGCDSGVLNIPPCYGSRPSVELFYLVHTCDANTLLFILPRCSLGALDAKGVQKVPRILQETSKMPVRCSGPATFGGSPGLMLESLVLTARHHAKLHDCQPGQHK